MSLLTNKHGPVFSICVIRLNVNDVHETEQLCLEWRDLENAKDKCAEVSVKSLNPSFVLCLVTNSHTHQLRHLISYHQKEQLLKEHKSNKFCAMM